jgi:site-specific recombinase
MWDWAVWGALILGFLAGTAALAALAVRARAAWSDVKAAHLTAIRRLDELIAKGETTADKIAAAGDTAELQDSLVRLRVSLARLAVLRDALDDARAGFRRVTAFVPRT